MSQEIATKTKRSILLVDDDNVALLTLASIIKSGGYNCIPTNSPYEAIEIFSNQPIDLLVTDMEMPGLDGIELFQELQGRLGFMRGILVSGYLNLEFMTRIMEAHFDDCIPKPANKEDLLLSIDRSLKLVDRWQSRFRVIRKKDHV